MKKSVIETVEKRKADLLKQKISMKQKKVSPKQKSPMFRVNIDYFFVSILLLLLLGITYDFYSLLFSLTEDHQIRIIKLI